MGAFVYILKCSDGSFYVGTTRTDLEDRIIQHNAGHFGGYTSKRRPVELVCSQAFERIADAVTAERTLKGWSRAKKIALVDGRLDALSELARRRTGYRKPA